MTLPFQESSPIDVMRYFSSRVTRQNSYRPQDKPIVVRLVLSGWLVQLFETGWRQKNTIQNIECVASFFTVTLCSTSLPSVLLVRSSINSVTCLWCKAWTLDLAYEETTSLFPILASYYFALKDGVFSAQAILFFKQDATFNISTIIGTGIHSHIEWLWCLLL